MVAGVGFEPHDLQVMSLTSYRTAPSRDENYIALRYGLYICGCRLKVKDFFEILPFFCLNG